MPFINVEIKAKLRNPALVRSYLVQNKAEYKGIDHQVDTYFNVIKGRLKLREGNIETNLIYYERDTQPGPKTSRFQLVKIGDPTAFKKALESALGIKVIVKKEREIYFIKNVKIHIDHVPALGSFIEIEAGNMLADHSMKELEEQCRYYLKQFGIKQEDLIAESYSDMLLK